MGPVKFISHRGNLSGPNPARENAPGYIDEAIAAGFKVEVDLRRVGSTWFLGHDYPQHAVDEKWLFDREDKLLMHVKDFRALQHKAPSWHTFCHSSDPFTFTSQGLLWLHDLSLAPNAHTIVPLMTKELILAYPLNYMHAICSDYRTSEHGNVYVPRGT